MKRTTLLLALLALALPGVRSAAQPVRSLRIAIVTDGPWERNESIRSLLQKEIGDVVGSDARVSFPREKFAVGDWTLKGVRALNDRLLADPDVDMILGMGVIASQDLATRGPLPKPVIAPVVIDAERQHVPVNNGTSGVKNLSYLVYPTTFVRDLQIYRDIIPIRTLVNISSKPYEDVLPAPAVGLVEQGRRLGVEVTELYIGNSADELLAKLPAHADAVFLEPMLHLPPAEFRKLVSGFIARRLPSFSFFGEGEVRAGIMASANPDIVPRLLRRVAMNVQRILSGEEPASLPVAFTPGKRLTINMSTANAVGVLPKWSTLFEAELVQIDTAVAGGDSAHARRGDPPFVGAESGGPGEEPAGVCRIEQYRHREVVASPLARRQFDGAADRPGAGTGRGPARAERLARLCREPGDPLGAGDGKRQHSVFAAGLARAGACDYPAEHDRGGVIGVPELPEGAQAVLSSP